MDGKNIETLRNMILDQTKVEKWLNQYIHPKDIPKEMNSIGEGFNNIDYKNPIDGYGKKE
jgi:hypothetical protein